MTLFLWFLFFLALLVSAIFIPKYLIAQRQIRDARSLRFKMICSSMFIVTGAVSALISNNTSLYAVFMMLGLVFSWFGDFFIHTKSKELFFVLGALGFLLAHVSYLAAYQKTIKHICGEKFLKLSHGLCLIAILSLSVFVFILLNVKVKKALIVIMMVYTLVLSTMLIKAVDLAVRYIKQEEAILGAGLLLILGAFLFFASDISLAILLLKRDKERFRLKCFNIVSYFLGQLMLSSTILFFNNKVLC